MQISFMGIFPRSIMKCSKNQIMLYVYTERIELRNIYTPTHVNRDLIKNVLSPIKMVYIILILIIML